MQNNIAKDQAVCPSALTRQKNCSFTNEHHTAEVRGVSRAINSVAEKPAQAPTEKSRFVQSESSSLRDKQLLERLSRSKLYRDYERTFTEATGLPLTLRAVEFFGLPFHGNKNENAFCAFLANGKESCLFCLQTQARATEAPNGQPHSVRCPFGLTETTVPIRLGERVIGFLCTGQVFTQSSRSALFKRSIRRLFPKGSTSEKKAFQLWRETPSMARRKYQASVQLLSFFAKQLSALSNQIVIEQANVELPVVTRARQFIAQHSTEMLSLTTVARAAGASVFHFCKIFHKSTGLRFTEYVRRVRAEDARVRLLNPNARISEVGYDAGFQSRTQFNRTFRRTFGQSPTEYRQALC